MLILRHGLGLFLLSALQEAPEPVPRLTGVEFHREKALQKVSASVTLVNPGKAEIAEGRARVAFFDGERELRESPQARFGKLAAGDSATVVLEAERVENFSRYELRIEAAGWRREYEGSPALPLPRLTKSSPSARPGDSAVGVELRGLRWFDHDPLEKGGEGAGDQPFLRLTVARAREILHPTGKCEIMVFQGDRPLKFLILRIDDSAWARDAADLGSRKRSAGEVAFDPLEGELWIGLLRVDRSRGDLKLDISLRLDEGGTWEWKGLTKPFRADPKPCVRK